MGNKSNRAEISSISSTNYSRSREASDNQVFLKEVKVFYDDSRR